MRAGLLDEVVAHYRGLLGERLVGLCLYGSRARGDARADSDLDLFLLADALPADRFARAAVLPPPRLDPFTDPAVSLRALTVEEYARDISSLDLDIALDGRVLWDRAGYLASRLALVRRRIEEAGLERDAELIWRWRRWPTRVDWAVRWEGVEL